MKLEGGEERWGPAGEENGVELYFVWRAAANKLDLSAECIRIGRNGSLLTRVGIEVTVGTAMTAKRDVNVHRVVKFHVSSDRRRSARTTSREDGLLCVWN